jgi:hypothetical protein
MLFSSPTPSLTALRAASTQAIGEWRFVSLRMCLKSDPTCFWLPRRSRICVYRYMPSWANFRMPYRPSPAFLEGLTPQRRSVVAPLWSQTLLQQPQRKAPDGGVTRGLALPDGRVKGWV